MRLGIAEVLEKISKLKKKEQKIEALKQNDSYAMRTILQAAFDPRIKFVLPEGTPPYKANDLPDQEGVLHREARKLVHFVEGGTPNLPIVKRETMFIELLENAAPADALLLLSIKEKKLPYKGINAELVKEAYPGLLP